MECYLDNSATTKVCNSAVRETMQMLTDNYGNPASLHKKGDEAKAALDKARRNVAKSLSCETDEIFFTSGGTESNNIAIFGAAEAQRRRGNRIVTTSIEHPSVAEPINRLERMGYEVVRIPVGKSGRIKEEDLFREINKNTILVSIMLVNNEVGSIMPIRTAKMAANRVGSNAIIHCDAVQAFSKMNVSPYSLGVDLLTVSSHKVHGPKGVGALYVRKGIRIVSPVYGGGQEEGVRSGTSPMPAIAGFGAAVAEFPDFKATIARMTAMRDRFISEVLQIPGIVINSPEDALPFIINISVLGIPSEVMRNELSSHGIYVSSGSACSKGNRSRVLTAMNFSNEIIDSALRITPSRYTTVEEMNMLLRGIASARQSIRYV